MSPQARQLTLSSARSLLPGRVRGTSLPAPPGESRVQVPPGALDRAAALLTEHGARFITLFVAGEDHGLLTAAFAFRGELVALQSRVNGNHRAYPSLSLELPAAWWPERELRDRFRVTPLALPDTEPIVSPDVDRLRRQAVGEDMFTLPYGPVGSGVFESIQFVIGTGGEDVTALEVRPFFKHRRLEGRFEGMPLEQGSIVAERVAGIASVAHATAFSQAVERALGAEPPRRAALWRAVYAELERIANHLDVAARLAEDAALAVGHARFAMLKEDLLRLQAAMTGSRFARGMVIPGGVTAEARLSVDGIVSALDQFEHELLRDRGLLLGTTSFTDRLIGSGRLDRATVERHAGVGPVARGSAVSTDARFERPYGAYGRLGFIVAIREDGDAMARLEVRFEEITHSLHLLRQALDRLRRDDYGSLAVALPDGEGGAFGWVEAPQGELVYWVDVADWYVRTVRIASPSYRNWPLFAESFRGDVLTDFAFIEHSFGLTPAGGDR
jgi:formate hydrogenlyase subunit 5